MCGIAGYLGDPLLPSPLVEAALLSGLRHRGPDAQGQLPFAAACGLPGQLFATRLAIVDLSPQASQPMRSTDGRLSLVFNGEIYNHAALRTQLKQAGAQFRTHSDTEVILAGYQHFGDGLWPLLRGMFALALWDGQRDELTLVRDAMGQKPLYFTCDALQSAKATGPSADNGSTTTARRLCFASEVRTLLAAQAVAPRINPVALAGYLTWGSVPEPHSIVAGVQPLLPGQLLRIRVRKNRLHLLPPQRFSAPLHAEATSGITQPAAIDTLRSHLAQTLHCHLQADVPVGILLSGGIDSTSIAAWARAVAPQKDLLAFTLESAAPDACAEVERARNTAQTLHLHHHLLQVSAASAATAAQGWLAALDQPTLDGYNTFLICEQVRAAGCKVVLGGAGGDELFFGYGLHRRFAAAWATYRHLPTSVQQRFMPSQFAAWLYRKQRRLFPSLFIAQLLQASVKARALPQPAALLPEQDDGSNPFRHPRGPQRGGEAQAALPIEGDLAGSPLNDPFPATLPATAHRWSASFAEGLARVQSLERQNYLSNTLLRDGDVLSMAHGVELRLPLCDPFLWSAVQALWPWPTTTGKGLLVAAAPPGDTRVATAAAHAKRGFELPLDTWLRGPLQSSVSALFSDPATCVAAGLQPPIMRRLWQVYISAAALPWAVRRRLAHRIWALYVWLAYVQRQALRFDD